MRYSANRMTYISVLALAVAFLAISVGPKLPSAASSASPSPAPSGQFCNTGSITINQLASATPFPSTINVPATGLITNLTVTLNNFSHTFPDDVDIMLVGPGGQNAIILSDVGNGTSVSNVTLTLDDAAATNLPDNGTLVSGTFKPTNFEGVETFSPGPPPSGGSALSVFNGTNPNGVWSLYVTDDTGDDGGSISGGWCLDITTVASEPCVLTCPSDVSQGADKGTCGAIVSYSSPTTSGDCGAVTCSPPSGSFFPMGTTAVSCTAAGGGNCSFAVTIEGTCPSGCNPSSITINQLGVATPFPSPLTITGNPVGEVISKVTVTLNNFNHTFPDDVDIMLVAPGGQNAIIMSDAGGSNAVSAINLTFDDAAPSNLLDNGPLVSGTFKPTNFEGVETFSPGPPPSGGSALSAFNGTDPNGTWKLYVIDDTGDDAGSISGGWCLNITTVAVEPCVLTCPADVIQASTPPDCGAFVTYPAPTTTGECGTVTCSPASGSFFPIGTTLVTCTPSAGASCSFNVTVTGTCPSGCNPSSITINPGGVASPYPSSISISGVSGTVASVSVTLNNLSHTFPDDVDILLVGPAGQNAIILSDVGGGTAATNVTLTLADTAAANLPDNGPLVSGMFKPTNFEGVEGFPAPAPAPSGGSALSVFNGTNANGVWKLYVVDDTGDDGGSISGGWCLNITATPPPCSITCPANITVSNTPGFCGAVVNYAAPSTTGSCGTVTCSPSSGSFFPVGTTTVGCTTTAGPTCSFTVKVNDTQPPTIVCPANVSATAPTGQTSTIVNYPPPTVSDNCPGVTFVCVPASGSSFPLGSTTVTCTATDASTNQASCTFKVTVSGAFLVNADSFIRDGADNTNEGGNNLLRIQSSGHNRVLVRFNLAGVSTVGLQSATLVLTIAENADNWGSTGRLVDAHRLLADWTEGNGHTVGDQPNFRGTGEGVTWNCAKDSNIANMNDDCLSQWNGGVFAAATAAPVLHTNEQIGPVSWDVTADVLAGASNGWVIKKQNEGKAGQVKYYSKEGAAVAGDPNLGPRLVLVYAP